MSEIMCTLNQLPTVNMDTSLMKKIHTTQKEVQDLVERAIGSEQEKIENDPVNHPAHYNAYQGEVECIDAIASMLGPEGFKHYCHGTVIKYVWRHAYKGKPMQDLKKAKWYLEKLMSLQDDDD